MTLNNKILNLLKSEGGSMSSSDLHKELGITHDEALPLLKDLYKNKFIFTTIKKINGIDQSIIILTAVGEKLALELNPDNLLTLELVEDVKIFISHQSNDKNIATPILKFIKSCFFFLEDKHIFFSSKDENTIQFTDEWRTSINNAIAACDIFVCIISESYRDSEICMLELGAAWGLKKKRVPLITKNITFGSFSQVINDRQAGKITKATDLIKMIQVIKKKLKITPSISQEEINKKAINCARSCKKDPIAKNVSIKKRLRKSIPLNKNVLVYNGHGNGRIMEILEDKRIVYPDFMTYYFLGNEIEGIEIVKPELITKLEPVVLLGIDSGKLYQIDDTCWILLNETLYPLPNNETVEVLKINYKFPPKVENIPRMTFNALEKGNTFRSLERKINYKKELDTIIRAIIKKNKT